MFTKWNFCFIWKDILREKHVSSSRIYSLNVALLHLPIFCIWQSERHQGESVYQSVWSGCPFLRGNLGLWQYLWCLTGYLCPRRQTILSEEKRLIIMCLGREYVGEYDNTNAQALKQGNERHCHLFLIECTPLSTHFFYFQLQGGTVGSVNVTIWCISN